MRNGMVFSGFAIVSLAFGAAAHAEVTPGFYVGASIGKGTVQVDSVDFDESDTAFKVLGGYSFNQSFAIELAYFDGGDAEMSLGDGAAVGVGLSGLNVSAVGSIPLGDVFTLFGKIGYSSYDAEVSAYVDGSTVFSEKVSDEDLTYGVGGAFSFGQSFSLRAEYEMLDASDAELNVLSIGGVYRF
jgi:OOP family OmpA-OmpF porin